LEERVKDGRAFKKRYKELVKGYMSVKENATNGLKILLGKSKAFSQVQASWRFLNNDNVTIEALFEPIKESTKEEIKKHCDGYV